jgi:hypothetical protein
MKKETLINFAMLGGLAFVLWKFKDTADKVTAPVSDAIANAIMLWNRLTVSPTIQLLGNIKFPSGKLVPISTLPIRKDGSGNVYTQYQGSVYQLQASDPQGNWPAIPVK